MSRLFWPVMVLVAAGLVVGCGPVQDAGVDRPKVIGASLLTQTHVFYQDMVAAMKVAAKEQNLTLRVQYCEFKSKPQNDHIDTFVAQGVDAILVSPADSSGITPAIAAAQKKGIPVFTVDIAAHGANVTSHIASDNERGGELLAEYLAKMLGGKAKIAIIDHPTVTSVQDRTRGFEKVLAQYPDMTIVQRVPGEGQRDKALRAAQDLLQAQPDLDAIFGINDDSALGALAAVEAAGMEDKIVIVGFDGTPEAEETIAAGKALKADAVQYPAKIGQTTIAIIADYLGGKEVPPVVPVAVGLIDHASLNAK